MNLFEVFSTFLRCYWFSDDDVSVLIAIKDCDIHISGRI